MNTEITYTFPCDCGNPQLAGKTLRGGAFGRVDGNWQGEPDCVRFADRVDGRNVTVVARIAGKPELEAALAAHKAEKQAVADRLSKSEYGYPQREAAAAAKADEALAEVRARYPDAARYAAAESYAYSSNYAKAAAGSRAMRAIESGECASDAIQAMEAQWLADATRFVAND